MKISTIGSVIAIDVFLYKNRIIMYASYTIAILMKTIKHGKTKQLSPELYMSH